MRIISIASGKGGVGKTTLVSNLGVILASNFGKKVLIVDCNITTSHLGLYLGMDKFPITLNHVLKGNAEVDDAIYDHSSGLRILPASVSLRDLEGVDVFLLDSVIKRVFKNYSKEIDFMFLDCAPGLGREAMAAFRASKEIMFVTTPLLPSVIDVVRCKYTIGDMHLNQLGTVLNMVRGNSIELSTKDIERVTNTPVLTSIPMDENTIKGTASGTPVVMSSSRSKTSRSIKRLAEVVLNKT
ncbi:MAG: cell division ATPase MinD [Candidatus Aenigmatarchaeota archaeon]|nr:MAG: cell division ATPase MinD [Candidatus Aenigmarchaeota archaeon]